MSTRTSIPSLDDTSEPTIAGEGASPLGDDAPQPTHLGRYVVIERLGVGGMGIVYAAYDPQLDRKVAVKLLLPGRGDAEGEARLRGEAQAMARLSHPHVVAVHDVGEHEGRVYLAMDFVKGETLRRWLALAPRSWRDVLALMIQAGRGLAAAHEAGLVHGDFKPDNVLVDERGRALVTDFGLARSTRGISSDEPSAGSSMSTTRIAGVHGTPAYLSPEQFAGGDPDARGDQFSYCVTLWEALHGERPFVASSVTALAAAVLAGKLREPVSTRVPRWLRAVARRGLTVDADARWPTMGALLAALERGQARGRNRGLVAGALGVALAIGGTELWRDWRAGQRVAACEAEGAGIDEVWDEGARARVREAIIATGESYAAITADRLTPWIDAHADRWRRARADVCLAGETIATDDRDRVLWCLDDRRVELEVLVDELSRADAPLVARAVTAAAALARIETCSDLELTRRMPSPPQERREEVRTLLIDISRARTLGEYAQRDAALEMARAATARAEELGSVELATSARLVTAKLLERRGDYAASERELVAAYVSSTRVGDDARAARAATSLMIVVGLHQARLSEGFLWSQLAEVAEERLGNPDPLLAASRLTNLGVLHELSGAFAEAQQMHERSLELTESALGADHPAVASALSNLANVHFVAGSIADARVLYERAIAISEAALGPEHPELVAELGNLANVMSNLNEYDLSRRLYRRGLAIAEASLGPEHPWVANSLGNLSVTYLQTSDYAQARELQERALAIREKALGPEHPDVAQSLNILGRIARSTGDYATARAHLQRALAIREKTFGPEHMQVASTLEHLARLSRAEDELDESRALHTRALAIREKAVGSDHPSVADTLVGLGLVELAAGRPADALAPLERALGIHDHSASAPMERAEVRWTLARALWDSRRDRARALELARTAAELLRGVERSDTTELAEIERWLAARQ